MFIIGPCLIRNLRLTRETLGDVYSLGKMRQKSEGKGIWPKVSMEIGSAH